MNYELAKKLKDAGFPQDSNWGVTGRSALYFEPSPQDSCPILKERHIENDSGTKIPTLSELIEACSESFYELRRLNQKYHSMPIDGMVWEASSPEITPMLYVASTPEQAVADLWLALNKK